MRGPGALRCGLWALGCGLTAAPAWKAPEKLAFGAMAVLEVREADPGAPPLPRPPVEQTLGPLQLRALEPSPDGRGWRLTVQALAPGRLRVPALDFGDGRRSPELRLEVPRSAPYGGMWMALGGGAANALPDIEFPWAWALLGASPLALIVTASIRRWRRGSEARARNRLAKRFRRAWPGQARDRATLDALHALGRELLAARFGEAARAWGPRELRAQHLGPWAAWCEGLDAARFGGKAPEFPAAEALLKALGDPA